MSRECVHTIILLADYKIFVSDIRDGNFPRISHFSFQGKAFRFKTIIWQNREIHSRGKDKELKKNN